MNANDSQRITEYKQELERIKKKMISMDPSSDAYGKLLGRCRALEDLIQSITKADLDEKIRLKEFDYKTAKESFEEELKSAQFEHEQYINEKRLDNDLKKEYVSAGKEVASTMVRGSLALAGTYLGIKATIAIATGMLSDESAGKLILSGVRNFVPKPNIFKMTF